MFSTQMTVHAKELTCDIELKKISRCASVEFIKTPNRKYSSDFKLKFFDKKNKKPQLLDNLVDAYLWMKMKGGHEHGTDKVKIKKLKDHYLVTNVWFVMLGNWQLHVKVVDKDEKVLDQGLMQVMVSRGTNNKK